ncbi:MAG: superoxide dismutase family protein [Bacillus sp. (in: firmicutes)]
MKNKVYLLCVLAFVFVLAACGNSDESEEQNDAGKQVEEQVINEDGLAKPKTVDFHNSEEEKIGTAELKETSEGVDVKVKASDLPEGEHGFHFHEKAACEAPTFESAGSHYNPTGSEHGLTHGSGPHAGDLPNLTVAEDGTVEAEFTAEMVTLDKSGETSLLKEGGTALVIHEKADDGKSQPSGDSGNRLACAVID